MDILILVALMIVTIIFFRKLSNVVYVVCIFDIFLRVITKLASMLHIASFSSFTEQNLPSSVLGMINKYSTGVINTALVWVYVAIYVVFLFYLIKYFFEKRK